MPKITEWGIWRNFAARISLVIVITGLVGTIIGMITNSRLIEQSLYHRAKAHFKDIVITWRWNANYGGVFVEKKPGMVSNPYLQNPDITAMDGKVYTKKNHALMTREISVIAQKEGDCQFHITSLNLLNPDNKPDAWEKQALESFEKGTAETFTRETRDGRTFYRYMAPLLVEQSCLSCHNNQGYKVGDVRGGISVSFDVTDNDNQLHSDQVVTALLTLLSLVVVLAGIFVIVNNLYRRLSEARKQLQTQAEVDPLTGLYNRRFFFEALERELERSRRYQNELSCVMLDLDHFKLVNDKYGHQAGDQVLQQLAETIRSNIRASDTAARYGGEEFIILMPQVTPDQAAQAAEKLCLAVARMKVETAAGSIQITGSFGVSSIDNRQIEKEMDEIVRRADNALYQAKASGRNCVRS